nr:MAG TPA: hypothetical protein [Caudoviricetes sp.]
MYLLPVKIQKPRRPNRRPLCAARKKGYLRRYP